MSDSTTKARILIVDDVRTNLNVLAQTLGDDYDIYIATNGQKALAVAASENLDLILLDIMMPDMDGYAVCEQLKADAKTRNILVIFVTAKDEDQDEAKGLALGAVDYITKPFSSAVVQARIRNHLELQRTTMALAHQNEKIRQQNEEIEKQNEELLKSVQLRDDVDQIIRHDLKSPLNIIIGMQDLLLNENLTMIAEDRERFLRIIEESGYRMLDMINRSHDLYKMEKGIYTLSAEPVNLLIICNRLMSAVQVLIANKNIAIRVLLDGQPTHADATFIISGEELLLYSMLSNLIKNAIEASPENESITILLAKTDVSTIRISNKGSVPMAIRDKFFDKYVTSEKHNGFGLGTYSAKLIATIHGGEIRLNTATEGETSIVIDLPL